MAFKKEGFQSSGEPSQAVNEELVQKTRADTPSVARLLLGERQPKGETSALTRNPGSSGLKAAAQS